MTLERKRSLEVTTIALTAVGVVIALIALINDFASRSFEKPAQSAERPVREKTDEAKINQSTNGYGSPAIANTNGNIEIRVGQP